MSTISYYWHARMLRFLLQNDDLWLLNLQENRLKIQKALDRSRVGILPICTINKATVVVYGWQKF